MEDITNTSHVIRIAASGGRGGCPSGLLHEPAVQSKPPAPASQRQESVRQVCRYGRVTSKSTDLELFRRHGDLAASVQDSPGCRGPSDREASHLLHSRRGAARGTLLQPYAVSGNALVDQSLASSLVLQDAAVHLNTVTRSLEQEGTRLHDNAEFFPFFEQKLGNLEKVCGKRPPA